MSDFINRLKELEISEDSFVNLNYTEGNDVWHINDGYVTDSVHETATASMLAGLLASGIPVYSNWGEPSEGNDILNGGSGNDTLIGGSGADTFFINKGINIIQDFDFNEGDNLRFGKLLSNISYKQDGDNLLVQSDQGVTTILNACISDFN